MKSKVLKTGIVLLALFCAYNLFWYFSTHHRYKEYIKGMNREYTGSYIHFADKTDPYNYDVALPGWLNYNGSISVNHNDKDVILLIWPNVFNDKMKYGVIVDSKSQDSVSIMIEKDGSVSKAEGYSDNEVRMFEERLKENDELITDLFKKANAEFDIGFDVE